MKVWIIVDLFPGLASYMTISVILNTQSRAL